MSGEDLSNKLVFVFNRTNFKRKTKDIPSVSFTCAAMTKTELPRHLKFCLKFLDFMRRRPKAHWFLEPVPDNEAIAPNYYKLIKYPMDFQTLTKNVYEQKYEDLASFKRDFDLIWSNCETYNRYDSEVGKAGAEMKSEGNMLWDVHTRLANDDTGFGIVSEMEQALQLCRVSVDMKRDDMEMWKFPRHLKPKKVHLERREGKVARTLDRDRDERPTYSPPSEDLMKQPMNTKEKYDMAVDLNTLPPELLGEVVDILAKSCNFKKEEITDVLEIPMNSLDNTVLRTIQAYIKSAKDKESAVRRMYQNDTISAEEQLKRLQEELDRINARIREKKPEHGSSTSENDTDDSTATSDTGSSASSSDDDSSSGSED